MLKDNFKSDKTNSIELRKIHDIGVGIAKSFINSKDEEVFIWHEYHYGEWPLDPRRKEIKSILKNYGGETVFQPWFKRLQRSKEFVIINTEEVKKDWNKFLRVDIDLMEYFVFYGKISNTGYEKLNNPIEILNKNGSISTINQSLDNIS